MLSIFYQIADALWNAFCGNLETIYGMCEKIEALPAILVCVLLAILVCVILACSAQVAGCILAAPDVLQSTLCMRGERFAE